MLQPGNIVERYRVESVLGRGGAATVYRVEHVTLGTVHALKVLHVDREEVRRRMVDEGRLQARIEHANIVRVSDVLTVDGAPALLMRFIDGPSLRDQMQRERLERHEALRLFRGVVAGVSHAHQHGVVHRDLKPANVMIDNDGRPMVTDFGLAKNLDPAFTADGTKTRIGRMMGTPGYMAPEQMQHAGGVDHRADIYSPLQ